jgi:hypothetical protein
MNAASNRFRSLAKGFRSRPHRPPGAYREWPKECRRGEIAARSINEHTLIPLVLLMASCRLISKDCTNVIQPTRAYNGASLTKLAGLR